MISQIVAASFIIGLLLFIVAIGYGKCETKRGEKIQFVLTVIGLCLCMIPVLLFWAAPIIEYYGNL